MDLGQLAKTALPWLAEQSKDPKWTFMICLISAFCLFASDHVLAALGLKELVATNKAYLGCALVLFTAVLVVFQLPLFVQKSLKPLKDRKDKKRDIEKLQKTLGDLPRQERHVIAALWCRGERHIEQLDETTVQLLTACRLLTKTASYYSVPEHIWTELNQKPWLIESFDFLEVFAANQGFNPFNEVRQLGIAKLSDPEFRASYKQLESTTGATQQLADVRKNVDNWIAKELPTKLPPKP